MPKRLTILGTALLAVAIVLFVAGAPRQLVLFSALVAVMLSARVGFQNIRAGAALKVSALPLATCVIAVAFVLLNWAPLVRGTP